MVTKDRIEIKPLPDDKFFDGSKLKAFADEKINVTEKKKMKFVLEMVENVVGKGENAGYQHFLLFPQYFQKASFSRALKVGAVWLPAFSPFPTIFQKGFFSRALKVGTLWLPAFSPFSTIFQKGFFFKGVKSWDRVVTSIFSFSHNIFKKTSFQGC